MSYKRVSFDLSFQDWAKASGIQCECGRGAHAYEDHKADCPMVVAATHWMAESQATYAALKALSGPEQPEA